MRWRCASRSNLTIPDGAFTFEHDNQILCLSKQSVPGVPRVLGQLRGSGAVLSARYLEPRNFFDPPRTREPLEPLEPGTRTSGTEGTLGTSGTRSRSVAPLTNLLPREPPRPGR